MYYIHIYICVWDVAIKVQGDSYTYGYVTLSECSAKIDTLFILA